ncbi:hypothetical protein EUBDOL_00243 [Amedibacillus dolichus DSM 3991]|uniref:Uncharacterized protein n=1 Tax=Amedibacillus dolichus DSM 3991 TaxID=428127 RepID=A8R8A8_9FIRM|nr:hypothetical protein EUBDOL_00243 [Amedibacillus dolichus DSM 3991]
MRIARSIIICIQLFLLLDSLKCKLFASNLREHRHSFYDMMIS